MRRISLFDEVRRRVAAEDCLTALGLGEPNGLNCPIHGQECMVVVQPEERWRCSAGLTGDVFDAVIAVLDTNVPGALRWLNREFDLRLEARTI